MLGLEARVAVNAVTAVLVFCECSSSVHLFQINTEMPSSPFKHVCCNPFNKKNHSGNVFISFTAFNIFLIKEKNVSWIDQIDVLGCPRSNCRFHI